MKPNHRQGVLQARPAAPTVPESRAAGEHVLALPETRPGSVLYVPEAGGAMPTRPLLLLLHGAGGTGRSMLPAFRALADETGTLLFAPNAREETWDFIRGRYGSDVRSIDAGLAQVFSRFEVDPERLAIGGFSDGASYALSLGVINGGLFSHVLAFSPGFLAPTRTEDSPRLFVTHGTEDRILPIARCSRQFVPELKRAGYDLTYREFEGGHVLPETLVAEAFRWFLGR